MTNPHQPELPALPRSYGDHCVTDSVRTMREPGYTASQMREYGAACATHAASRPADGVPDGMLIVQKSDAECLVRDAERFIGESGGTAGGRLARKRVRAILDAAPKQTASAPTSAQAGDGFVTVPRELTTSMAEAAAQEFACGNDFSDAWEAAIATYLFDKENGNG